MAHSKPQSTIVSPPTIRKRILKVVAATTYPLYDDVSPPTIRKRILKEIIQPT